VNSRLEFFNSEPYYLICGLFLKSLGVWSTYVSTCSVQTYTRFDVWKILKTINFPFLKINCSSQTVIQNATSKCNDPNTTDRHKPDELSKRIT